MLRMKAVVRISLIFSVLGMSACSILHQTKPVKHSKIEGLYAGSGLGFSTGLAATSIIPIPLGAAIGGAFGLTVGTLQSSVTGLTKVLQKEGAQVVRIGDRIFMYLPADKIFKHNSDQIKANAYTMLTSATAMALLHQKDSKILISGHTDNVMGKAENIQLSKRQADRVMSYMWAEGIPHDAIQSEGKGPLAPIASNVTTLGNAANRHIMIVVRTPNFT